MPGDTYREKAGISMWKFPIMRWTIHAMSRSTSVVRAPSCRSTNTDDSQRRLSGDSYARQRL